MENLLSSFGIAKVLSVEILHDAGRAINPAIEQGQIYGGFIQGMGWHTTEKINWNAKGELLTKNWSTYKIPTVSDTPSNFDVKFFKNNIELEKIITTNYEYLDIV